MAVHSIHIFDRRGKTLFTKRYAKSQGPAEDAEQLSEQRKLVFGMLFSLRELVGSLAPESAGKNGGALHSIKTAAGTLHNYETISGMRIALYTDNNNIDASPSIRTALKYIYTELWVELVLRSPLYVPNNIDIRSTNFEQKLDAYLGSMPWFR